MQKSEEYKRNNFGTKNYIPARYESSIGN